jgi:membrane associated rhomboid family serine protease
MNEVSKVRFNAKILPVYTLSITIILISLFLLSSENSRIGRGIIEDYSFVPIKFSISMGRQLFSLITANLLHVDAYHLLGNVLFFLLIGRRIERAVGGVVFVFAFLGLGALSFLGSWLIAPDSHVRIVGASGAISFMMGAYLLLFPRVKIFLFPFQKKLFCRFWIIGFAWIGNQIFMALNFGERLTGVAYWTHIMGFLIGAAAAAVWREFGMDTQRRIEQAGSGYQ